MSDPGSVPMSDPLAYFLTWTTYGTWLPGDEREWVKEHKGLQLPDHKIEHEARRKLREPACTLDDDQRRLVEETIRRHCELRKCKLFAVSCRTNHVHVIVAAPVGPSIVMDQLKAWCSRQLKEYCSTLAIGALRENSWTENGSRRFLNDEPSLEAAIQYVLEGQ